MWARIAVQVGLTVSDYFNPVMTLPDNVSVTFSPDSGAVFKETKTCEYPRRVKGA